MSKRTPGLYLKRGIWQIDKQIAGIGRIRKSTQTGDLAEAERYLSVLITRLRKAVLYGEREPRSFREGATKYINEATHKTISRDLQSIDALMPFIGNLDLLHIHDGTLAPFVAHRSEQFKSATIRRDLAICRRILTLAARKWRDAAGNTWIPEVPMLTFPDWGDARKPFPLSWDQQRTLLKCLAPHLHKAALYAVNTGLRDVSQTQLRWEWEVRIPEINASVFVIPGEYLKGSNADDHVVVHNSISSAVIESCRGNHPEFVFTYEKRLKPGGPLVHVPTTKFANSGWKRGRKKAGLDNFRWHDWRHTFARRLRSARVSTETRKVLLGHKNQDITTHYSAIEIQELIDAVSLLEQSRETTLLRAIK